jgi:hypothetical protein
VGVTDSKPVGNALGVVNWNKGVAVGPGVAVVNPWNATVGVGPGRGGFCQIYKKALMTKHSAINPQPNPPSRNLSNKGLNFAGNFIEFTQSNGKFLLQRAEMSFYLSSLSKTAR